MTPIVKALQDINFNNPFTEINMKTLIKLVVLYTTITLSMVLLCSEVCWNWLVIAGIVALLTVWCVNHITLRELVKLTGYEVWYKFLRK